MGGSTSLESGEEWAVFLAGVHPLFNGAAHLEVNLEDEDGLQESFITPGWSWQSKTFELGFGIPVGLGRDEPDWGIAAQITWEWGGD
ncbi:MAG: hypothetical protein QNK37_25350 [Acidobacteriota bacterium]|nr:hypothetical protein [Acidobacteriota bacterium]